MSFIKKAEQRRLGGCGLEDEHGAYWDSPGEFVQGSVLGFCTCGEPNKNLEYIRNGLRLIKNKAERTTGKEISVFGSECATFFFYYWALEKGFTEHGNSVPGWLTDEGEALLSDLESIDFGDIREGH